MENSVLIQNLTSKQLTESFEDLKKEIQSLKKNLSSKNANDELLTREETCKFLKINSSTLWAWTNKGKVKAYGIGNRRFYKRAEILEALKELKK